MRIDPAAIGPVGGAAPARPGGPQASRQAGPSFQQALTRASSALKLSRHAQHRLDRRDLDLGGDRLARLEGAVERAALKGARNSVVMLDDLAVVVDVRQRTIVTAMNQEGGRERVFTNIDSVVIA